MLGGLVWDKPDEIRLLTEEGKPNDGLLQRSSPEKGRGAVEASFTEGLLILACLEKMNVKVYTDDDKCTDISTESDFKV